MLTKYLANLDYYYVCNLENYNETSEKVSFHIKNEFPAIGGSARS